MLSTLSSISNVAHKGSLSHAKHMKKPSHAGIALAVRIVKSRGYAKLSQTGLAKAVGVSRGAVGQWESATTAPSSENLRKIADRTRVSHDWLSNNRGEMVLPDDYHLESDNVLTEPLERKPAVAQGVAELEVRGGMGGGGVPSIEVRRDGKHADAIKPELWFLPNQFVREELRSTPRGLVIVETQGDSMTPTILPGERVFVDTGHKRPSPDGVYAIRDQFGALEIKRVHALSQRGKFLIISDNKAHPDKPIELRDLEIVGRVVGAIRRF